MRILRKLWEQVSSNKCGTLQVLYNRKGNQEMKGRPRKGNIPVNERKNVVAMYLKTGLSIKEIAYRFGVTTYIVRQALREADVKIRPRGRRAFVERRNKWREERAGNKLPAMTSIEAEQPSRPNLGAALERVEQTKAAVKNNLDKHLEETTDQTEMFSEDYRDMVGKLPSGEKT